VAALVDGTTDATLDAAVRARARRVGWATVGLSDGALTENSLTRSRRRFDNDGRTPALGTISWATQNRGDLPAGPRISDDDRAAARAGSREL
jgi:hypothetical protein